MPLDIHTMDRKLVMVFVALFGLLAEHVVHADFLYNKPYPKPDEVELFGLRCVPGRTVIKVDATPPEQPGKKGDDSEEDGRRTHMNFPAKEENCQICVCSVDGKNEYCSRRPAMNVNECLSMSKLVDDFNRNEPYDHEKTLAYRIRRDYIWHNDEIPYESKAKCRRGHSYYTNSATANNTDIDVDTEVESLLDYPDKEICSYCICSTSGESVGCINRDPAYCHYFRLLRDPDTERSYYAGVFNQDRPALFQTLSHRLRRTMDEGIFILIDSGGDALCCDHPAGHRRNLHNTVRRKIWQNKRRQVPKENLMSGSPAGDYVDFIVNNDK